MDKSSHQEEDKGEEGAPPAASSLSTTVFTCLAIGLSALLIIIIVINLISAAQVANAPRLLLAGTTQGKEDIKSEEEWRVVKALKRVVVMVHGKTCPGCLATMPKARALAKKHRRRTPMVFVEQYDITPAMRKDFARAALLPSFLLLESGQVKKVVSGAQTEVVDGWLQHK